jgi:hypothetical protein
MPQSNDDHFGGISQDACDLAWFRHRILGPMDAQDSGFVAIDGKEHVGLVASKL